MDSILKRLRSNPWFYTGLFFAILLTYPRGLGALHPSIFIAYPSHALGLFEYAGALMFCILFFSQLRMRIIFGSAFILLFFLPINGEGFAALGFLIISPILICVYLLILSLEEWRANRIARDGLCILIVVLLVPQWFVTKAYIDTRLPLAIQKNITNNPNISLDERLRNCQTIKDVETANDCSLQNVWNEARKQNDDSLCRLLSTEHLQVNCISLLYQRSDDIPETAVKFCASIQNSQEHDACFLLFGDRNGLRKNEELCAKYLAGSEMEKCYKAFAVGRKKVELCDFITSSETQALCRSQAQ